MSTADLPWADAHGTPVVAPTRPLEAERDAKQDSRPSAIEPQRVMILDEDEQKGIIDGLYGALGGPLAPDWRQRDALTHRIANGDTYTGDLDEIARRTLRKRRLLAEVKRETVAIERLTEPVVEMLAEVGAKSLTHEATGTRIQRDDAVHLAYADPDWGAGEKADAKDAAGQVIAGIDELAGFVQQTWAQRTVEAYFRERYKAALEEQCDKPEHERTPVDADEILPEALRPYYRLAVKPRLKIVAT